MRVEGVVADPPKIQGPRAAKAITEGVKHLRKRGKGIRDPPKTLVGIPTARLGEHSLLCSLPLFLLLLPLLGLALLPVSQALDKSKSTTAQQKRRQKLRQGTHAPGIDPPGKKGANCRENPSLRILPPAHQRVGQCRQKKGGRVERLVGDANEKSRSRSKPNASARRDVQRQIKGQHCREGEAKQQQPLCRKDGRKKQCPPRKCQEDPVLGSSVQGDRVENDRRRRHESPEKRSKEIVILKASVDHPPKKDQKDRRNRYPQAQKQAAAKHRLHLAGKTSPDFPSRRPLKACIKARQKALFPRPLSAFFTDLAESGTACSELLTDLPSYGGVLLSLLPKKPDHAAQKSGRTVSAKVDQGRLHAKESGHEQPEQNGYRMPPRGTKEGHPQREGAKEKLRVP